MARFFTVALNNSNNKYSWTCPTENRQHSAAQRMCERALKRPREHAKNKDADQDHLRQREVLCKLLYDMIFRPICFLLFVQAVGPCDVTNFCFTVGGCWLLPAWPSGIWSAAGGDRVTINCSIKLKTILTIHSTSSKFGPAQSMVSQLYKLPPQRSYTQ